MSENLKALNQCLIADRHRLGGQLSRAKTTSDREKISQKIALSVQKAQARKSRLPSISYPPALPISERAQELIKLIQAKRVLIVAGETGSGKSTQLPKICLAAGQGVFGQIAHTQPRRIAARAIANRLADELKVDLSAGVGYRVRFEDKSTQTDYICVMTDGMLLAEAQSDPYLNRYDTLIVDEAHERSLNIDFLLGYLKQLLVKRKDLKLIITSATIDTQKFSKHFGGAPIVSVSGRTYPVEVFYQAPEDEKNRSDLQTNQAILQAIENLFNTRPGNTLVFLPGEREIHEVQRFLERRLKSGIEVLPLYARLSGAAQSRLFRPSHSTRVILSTNVAETSLTLPGIEYVVDVGLARVSRYSATRRVNTLPIERISKAAANQRMGRCGRVKKGVCIRLYSEQDFLSRDDYTAPEILRTALTGVMLSLKSRSLGEPEAFPFIDLPERKQWNSARQELKLLGALDEQNALTAIGKMLVKLPVDPRIGRMLYAAAFAENCLAEMTILAASLETPDPRLVPHDALQAARQHHLEQAQKGCDFFALIHLFQAFEQQRSNLSRKQLSQWCQRQYLSPARMREWQDLKKRLSQDLTVFKAKVNTQAASEEAVHRALFCGLLDQIAMKSDKGAYTGTFGKQLSIFPGSALAKTAPKWIMAAEMVETSQLFARRVAPIKVEWIETLASSLIRHEYSEPHWSPKSGAVLAYQRGYFLNLPIFSGRRRPYEKIDPEDARAIFIRDALVTGEIKGQFEFIDFNLTQIDNVIKLEHKARRHDMLVSDEALAQFYAEQLPETVLSESSLRRWLKTLNTESLALLKLNQAYLLKRELSNSEQNFPDSLQTNGYDFALDYQFKPGSSNDGVSAKIPLSLLNQLSQSQFDKLVPGYLEEKIEHLIRSLSKAIRKQLAPIAATAVYVNKQLKQDDRPLLEAMAQVLNSHAGLTLSPGDFNLNNLPDHLTMNLALVDEAGNEIGYADQLLDLQQQFGQQARDTLVGLNHPWQQQGLTSWCFDDIPESVVVDSQGFQALAYPALVDAGSCVNLQLFDHQLEAKLAHHSGIVRLIQIGTDFGKRLLKRPLPYWHEISLRYSPIGAHSDLRLALIDSIIDGLRSQTEPFIRTKKQFLHCLAITEQGYKQKAEQSCHALKTALNAYSDCILALSDQKISGQSLQDIQGQLDYLIYEDFLLEVSLSRLHHYPSYFKALAIRIERLKFDPLGDAKKMALLMPYWQAYLSHWQAHPHNSTLDQFRWQVEAYRISLFAPTLKTPEPVSPKRLDNTWADFKASLHT